jgi:hypothetical protein
LEILLVFHGPSVHVHAIPSMDRPWNSTSMPTSAMNTFTLLYEEG